MLIVMKPASPHQRGCLSAWRCHREWCRSAPVFVSSNCLPLNTKPKRSIFQRSFINTSMELVVIIISTFSSLLLRTPWTWARAHRSHSLQSSARPACGSWPSRCRWCPIPWLSRGSSAFRVLLFCTQSVIGNVLDPYLLYMNTQQSFCRRCWILPRLCKSW